MRKGLDRGAICDAALKLIDERGFERFSLTALAKELGVKTASLYNHISGLGDLLQEVGARAAQMMNLAAEERMRGKRRLDALMELAFSLREYAAEHPGLYHLMVRGTMNISKDIKDRAEKVVEPIAAAVGDYRLTPEQRLHWIRIIRAAGYGFILHEQNGAYASDGLPPAESYRVLVEAIHASMCAAEKENDFINQRGE